MTDERYEEIDARLLALETIIAMMVPILWRDGSLEQRLFIENLRDQAAAMRTMNVHSAAIGTYERVARLADDDPTNLSEKPPSGPKGKRGS